MSNNRTIIPGMEPSSYDNGQHPGPVADSQSLQSGIMQGQGMTYQRQPETPQASRMQTKPVVGFLYSISRNGAGEYWPLHIGSNSIGRSAACDICLAEGTVSEDHAKLVVRQMKNPEKVIASICDSSSTIGTMLNGESLGFDQRECFNGDVITVGAHYDLYLILIDAKQIGLQVCSDFIPVADQQPSIPMGVSGQVSNPTVEIGNPYAPPANGYSKRTRGFDGMEQPMGGGTQGMPDLSGGNPDPGAGQPQGGGRTIFM